MREKGSKTAMVKLVKSNDFINIINDLLENSEATITSEDVSFPNVRIPNKEVTLSTFIRQNFDAKKATNLTKWWIKHGTATPKWDLISTCTIDGKRGILLVEAKAHKGELKKDKKLLKKGSSIETEQNHEHIESVIDDVKKQLKNEIIDIAISRDNCYQFSNRVAHSWWLANQGIPVVLLYLGFLNVDDMENKYKIFKTHKDWEDCFIRHTKMVEAVGLIDRTVNCGASSFKMICRSLKS
uniref:hypothetical protein n=1 Tax=Flavobacterium sp. TaxID=239 RepID=UPI00404A6732